MIHLRLLLAVALLGLASTASAQDFPAKVVVGKAGELVVLKSDAKGEVVWYIDGRLRNDKNAYQDKANKSLVLTALAGAYTVVAFETGTPPKLQEWTVLVEGGPLPPGPLPPGPVPPDPNTLTFKLKVAFEADKAAGKGAEADKAKLAELFAGLAKYTDNVLIKVVGDAHAFRTGAVDSVLGAKLPATVKATDDYVLSKIPEAGTTPLTAEIRGRYKAALLDVESALGSAPIPPGPMPVAGFRVIFVSETIASLTKEQLNILNSTAIRDYLNKKAAKTGTRPDYRYWDKDVNVSGETETFKKLWAIVQTKLGTLPQMAVVGNDGAVQIFALTTEQETLATLRKIGGE